MERAALFRRRLNLAVGKSFTDGLLRRAFAIVEERGGFRVDEVSPVIAATRISAPVLLIHGEADIDTPPAHSQRVFAALKGPRRLLLVPGAAHNTSLTPGVWAQIEEWLEAALCDSSPRSSFHKVCNLPAQSARSREPPV